MYEEIIGGVIYQMHNNKIYIMLSDTGTLFTRTIKQYTKAPYNHASIAFDKELNEIYSFGRKHPKNPINGGFVREDVFNGTYRSYPNTTCVLLEVEVTKRHIEKMRRIINLFEKNRGKLSYNLLGVVGVALNERFEPQGSYFCSQFVAELLIRSGLNYWDKEPSLITPEDIRSTPSFKLIYEGKLFDYQPIKNRIEKEL